MNNTVFVAVHHQGWHLVSPPPCSVSALSTFFCLHLLSILILFRRFHEIQSDVVRIWEDSFIPWVIKRYEEQNRDGGSSCTSKDASHYQICVRRYSSMAQSYPGTRFARRHLIFGNILMSHSIYYGAMFAQHAGYVTRVPAFSFFLLPSVCRVK